MTTNWKFIWSHLLSWWITSLQLFLSSSVGRITFVKFTWWNVFTFYQLWTSVTYFWSLVIRWLGEPVIGEEPKKKKKKKAFNHLKPTCNSLAWNLEAASHDKFPLHNNGLQLLWIKFLPYCSKKKKHKIWYFILRKDFPNPNHH